MKKEKKQGGGVSVKISRECYETIKRLAEENGRKISGQIEFMLRQS